jgi:hypothetical protein
VALRRNRRMITADDTIQHRATDLSSLVLPIAPARR